MVLVLRAKKIRVFSANDGRGEAALPTYLGIFFQERLQKVYSLSLPFLPFGFVRVGAFGLFCVLRKKNAHGKTGPRVKLDTGGSVVTSSCRYQ